MDPFSDRAVKLVAPWLTFLSLSDIVWPKQSLQGQTRQNKLFYVKIVYCGGGAPETAAAYNPLSK
jgi:hypothetical protein